MFGRTTTITCRRVEPGQVSCASQLSCFGWLPLDGKHTIRYVQAARLDASCSCSTRSFGRLTCVYYVQLESDEGLVSVSPDLGKADADRVATQINTFIDSPDPKSLTMGIINCPWALIGVMCTFVPGLIMGGWLLWLGLAAYVRGWATENI